MVLKYAEISENGAIQVLCEFTDDYPDSSCVVVYREHNSTVLTVIDYPHTTIFPVSVTVGKYPTSLSVFGKDRENNMDKKPFTAKLIKATSVMPTTPMSSGKYPIKTHYQMFLPYTMHFYSGMFLVL